MKFNLDDYADTDTMKYAMHCKTEEEAKEFCALLDRAGRHWFNSKPYNRTRWNTYKEDTCYFFNDGHYGCYKTLAAESHRCTILEWSDFQEDTPSDTVKFVLVQDLVGCGKYRLFRAPGGVDLKKGDTCRSPQDRKSTSLNSSHANISYAVFCLK